MYRSVDRARRDRIDAHPARRQLAGKRLREVVECRLGHGVDGLTREPQCARGGGDVDHRADWGGLQVGKGVAHQEERRSYVDRHVLVKACQGPLSQREVAHDGRIVDQAVDGAEAVDRRGDDPARALDRRQVGRNPVRLAAGLGHRLRTRGERLGPAPDEHDMGTGCPEAQRRRGTYATASPGHDDHGPAEAQVGKPATVCNRRGVHRTSILERHPRGRAPLATVQKAGERLSNAASLKSLRLLLLLVLLHENLEALWPGRCRPGGRDRTRPRRCRRR